MDPQTKAEIVAKQRAHAEAHMHYMKTRGTYERAVAQVIRDKERLRFAILESEDATARLIEAKRLLEEAQYELNLERVGSKS